MIRLLTISLFCAVAFAPAAFSIEDHNTARSNRSNAVETPQCADSGGVEIEHQGNTICGMPVDGDTMTAQQCRESNMTIITADRQQYCVPGEAGGARRSR